jgi:fluoride exporter
LTKLLWVGAGGALGSIARYLFDGLVLRWLSPYFPSGTFAVNVVGCLAFGAIIGFAEGRSVLTPTGRLFLLIGLLGGFTTFSTFTFESFQLVRSSQFLRAGVNVAGQVILGYAAMWGGFSLVRLVWGMR